MFYRERFHDLGSTYVIADASEFHRSQLLAVSSLERVPRLEVGRCPLPRFNASRTTVGIAATRRLKSFDHTAVPDNFEEDAYR